VAKLVSKRGLVDTRALDATIDESGNIISNIPEVPVGVNLEAPFEPQIETETEKKTEIPKSDVDYSKGPENANKAENVVIDAEYTEIPFNKSVTDPNAVYKGDTKTNQYAPPQSKKQNINQGKKRQGPIAWFEENVLDMKNKDTGPYSQTTDRLAALGGYSRKAWRTIVEEKQNLTGEYEDITDKANAIEDEYNRYRTKAENLKNSANEAYRLQYAEKDELVKRRHYQEYQKLENEANEAANQAARFKRELYNINAKKSKLEDSLGDLQQEQSKYQFAVAKGAEIDKKEHHWRKEWAKPIAENTSNMLGRPVIGNVTDVVGYGDATGKTMSAGLNELVGGYKTASGANEWARTRVGDRQLVEALVTVRPNNMITPFGTSGTIGGSSLTSQFEYNTPLRRIAVGDVTARPGYILNIEDIHRKRKGKSAPKLARKKVVKPSLKRASISNGMAGITSAMSKLNNIKTPTGKTSHIKSITNIGKSGILLIKGTSINMKGNSSAIKKAAAVETKPYSLNLNGISAIKPITLEMNLNNQSKFMKKRKLVNV